MCTCKSISVAGLEKLPSRYLCNGSQYAVKLVEENNYCHADAFKKLCTGHNNLTSHVLVSSSEVLTVLLEVMSLLYSL